MDKKITKAKSIKGTLRVPSDKSISHRSVILSSISDGTSIIKNYLKAGDTLTTVDVYRKLGVKIDEEKGLFFVHGVGLKGLKEPEDVLYMGNSGTTTRLTLGVLAGQNIFATLTGDNSLRKRPMKRVLLPLKNMGANVDGRNKGEFLPVAIRGGSLRGIEFFNEKASAQVKSALLLAGLNANRKTTIIEPVMSRDHTERMLKAMGANIKTEFDEGGYRVHLFPSDKLNPIDIDVPADPSSAAFFVAAAVLVPNSEILLKDVLINPTRDGFFRKLKEMGANIEYTNHREQNGEPVADILAKYSPDLKAISVEKREIPSMIDELPLLALVATQAEGETVIKGAEELRVKESDRIKAVVENLKQIGVKVEELPDGMIIKGKQKIKGGIVDSFHDHRIAMAFSILALISEEGIEIKNADCASISYPEFYQHLESLIEK
ncbi:3-phosphoshikimate 1-carboxyvinyltransferase [Hydrogenothermus marinus]|uniref:3-phosphoshikimate 1-carboxyvinyltransferase n=1 Tax=Hydrogenothermus marinus TaxID=133270 RepID=A0A3M0BFJ1_9AQUI|nr:3-phosphoshikimate 1-carboxyvinyltransferase [Hydrogenothermus marinus]RMA96080.1 3-phosphoshikimate 1-carboxyvinyltransferase [Hydrogenothermus marinus]